ncbi:MAG: hypothetical protein ACOC9D_01510, partial [Thermodesulfobacteriota bacterium]
SLTSDHWRLQKDFLQPHHTRPGRIKTPYPAGISLPIILFLTMNGNTFLYKLPLLRKPAYPAKFTRVIYRTSEWTKKKVIKF